MIAKWDIPNEGQTWKISAGGTVRTLREDQPLRLLSNLLFYHFNRSEPNYKSQHIKLLDVIAVCSQLNVNALKPCLHISRKDRKHRLDYRCLKHAVWPVRGHVLAQSTDPEIKATTDCLGSLTSEMLIASPSDTATGAHSTTSPT